MNVPDTIAAVDLGSNSFHMVIARTTDGDPRVVDRLKESVRLAAGLDEERVLSDIAAQRALDCLERFGQRLRQFEPRGVRVVGTNTLRQARNASAFMARAAKILGHPIEVISGLEEARLIYLGVAHSVARGVGQTRRLVVDIGGGSTECIVGEGYDPLESHSLYMGCVEWTERYFAGGRISEKRMERAELAAGVELEPLASWYQNMGWKQALGSSGTLTAIGEVLRANGWTDGAVTRDGLAKLRERVLATEDVRSLEIDGLKPDRAPVFPGGVAIASAVLAQLKVDRLDISPGAMREGVLWDLIGRYADDDVRERTVSRVMATFHVDEAQATRVQNTALKLLALARDEWDLERGTTERMLRWAAQLHEVGLMLSYAGYHKHGFYLLQHAHLAGFSRDEQHELAALVGSHRRRLRDDVFEELPGQGERSLRLCVLLRLAVLLHRGRTDDSLPRIGLELGRTRLELRFPGGWLDSHALTRTDLEGEAAQLTRVGWTLKFR